MAQTVIGLFENETDAQRAVQNLAEAGISRDQVDLARGTGRDNVSTNNDRDNTGGNRDGENGITRFFKNLFGDTDDAERHSRVGNSGYTVVTVHAQSESDATRAADILDDSGAVDVDERAGEYPGERQGVRDDGTPGTRGARFPSDDIRTDNVRSEVRGTDAGQERTVSRVEEELRLNKQQVETSGTRLRSRIVEKPVDDSIRLREERVHTDRQNVDRPVSDGDRGGFQDQDIEFVERAEVPVVNKESRVVEELNINNELTGRDETTGNNVRNAQAGFDKLDGDDPFRRGDDSQQNFDRNRNNI